MTVKIINLEQNNDAWLAWRLGRIGGSDASIICYESPYKNPYKLWQEKTGIIPPKREEDEDAYTPFGKKATKHGKDTEPEARDAFAEETGLFLPPACLEQDGVPDVPMSASLDGYSAEESAALEIKCPKTIYDYIEVAEGRIPDSCYPQVMHNWFVAQTERFFFYAYFKDQDGKAKGALLTLGPKQRDNDYVSAMLIPEERRFWMRVVDKRWPTPNGESDRGDNPHLCEYAKLWADFTRQERAAAKKARLYKAALMREMDALHLRRMTVNGVQITASTRRGFVNYKQAMADLGVTLQSEDQYRGPDSLIHEIVQVKA
jgi:putative phage-type endonuclease